MSAWFLTPDDSQALQRTACALVCALLLAVGMWLLFAPGVHEPVQEGKDYMALAQGRYGDVHDYYGGRFLHPWVVRQVALFGGFSTQQAFYLTSHASLLVLGLGLALYFSAETTKPLLLMPLFVLPAFVDAFRNYYFSELFYAALLVIFFLFLQRNAWLSLPVLFALQLTRESTVLLTATIVLVCLARRSWKIALASLLTAGVGVAVTASRALPNHHQVPTLLFYPLKATYNFCLNVLGLQFWTDTNMSTITRKPSWVIDVPSWLHLGRIHQFGFCAFDVRFPLTTLLAFLASFGILTLLVASLLAHGRLRLVREGSLAFVVALYYGSLSLAAAPFLGNAGSRYEEASWPAFLLAAAVLLPAAFAGRLPLLTKILALTLLSAWLPQICYWLVPRIFLPLTVALELVLYGVTVLIFRREGVLSVLRRVADGCCLPREQFLRADAGSSTR